MQPWIDEFDGAVNGYHDLHPALKYLCARVLAPLAGVATACLRGEIPRNLATLFAKEIGSETLNSMMVHDPDGRDSIDRLVLQLSRHVMNTPKFSEPAK
jgi:hypothetical protein